MNNRSWEVIRGWLAIALCAICATPAASAQDPSIQSEKPTGNILIRPYRGAIIPPNNYRNSPRLENLVRAGKLYLTVQDAVALALENNIDIAFDRYNALIDQWLVERYSAGGALPGVPSGSSQAKSVTGGEGVSGSQSAAGVSSGGGSSTSSNSVGATISQIGSVAPTLDPVVQSSANYTHLSNPQPEQVLSLVTNLIQNSRIYTASITDGLITGGNVTLSYRDQYLNENAPSDLLNPETATVLSFSLSHNLLQGFGRALNSRSITAANVTVKVNQYNFKTEVMSVVANVLNLYYGLVADYEDLKAKQSALDVARQFYENNKKQVQIGTMAPLDVTTAEAQVATSEQDLVQSEATLEQQQVSLKNTISRTGLAEPLLREVQIIPLDRIDVPEKDDLPPMKTLVTTALQNRSDLEAERLNLVNDRTNALNTANAVLPTLKVLAGASTQGLSGAKQYFPVPLSELGITGANPASGTGGVIPPGFVACPPSKASSSSVCAVPDNNFIGGVGTALGQMLRRDFPTQNVGGYIVSPLYNRQALADQAIDVLSIRQAELQQAKDLNQVVVDVNNQVVSLQQARVRYQAAVRNRILEDQLLAAEQKKFSLGASTTYLVVQQQRDLATAQATEVAALVTYSNARVSLDQSLGTTLVSNHISIDEAVQGQVKRPSVLPVSLPAAP